MNTYKCSQKNHLLTTLQVVFLCPKTGTSMVTFYGDTKRADCVTIGYRYIWPGKIVVRRFLSCFKAILNAV